MRTTLGLGQRSAGSRPRKCTCSLPVTRSWSQGEPKKTPRAKTGASGELEGLPWRGEAGQWSVAGLALAVGDTGLECHHRACDLSCPHAQSSPLPSAPNVHSETVDPLGPPGTAAVIWILKRGDSAFQVAIGVGEAVESFGVW